MPRWHTTIQNPSPCERNKGNCQNTMAQCCGGKKLREHVNLFLGCNGWVGYMETEFKYKTLDPNYIPTLLAIPSIKHITKLGVCFLQDQRGSQKLVTY